MDFASAIQSFAEAWAASNSKYPGLTIMDNRTRLEDKEETEDYAEEIPGKKESSSISICDHEDRKGSESNDQDIEGGSGGISAPLSHQIANILASTSSTRSLSPHNSLPGLSSSSPKTGHNLMSGSFESSNDKKIPLFIKCEIEPVNPDSFLSKNRLSHVLVEISSSTPFFELLETVLTQIGFFRDEILNAEGELLLTNWKALPLKDLADESSRSVYDIFNQISSVPTIKIVVKNYKKNYFPTPPSPLMAPSFGSPFNEEVREKVMSLLVEQYYKDAALRLRNTLSGPSLRPTEPLGITPGIFRSENNDDNNNSNKLPTPTNGAYESLYPLHNISRPTGEMKNRDEVLRWQKSYFDSIISNASTPKTLSNDTDILDKPRDNDASAVSAFNFFQGYSKESFRRGSLMKSGTNENNFVINKPRMRVCFDPETEIPRLQRWFAENNHPTRQQVEEFVRELNSLECRKGRKSLDVNNVIYWFKNTRAAVKRAEMKSKQQNSMTIPPPTSATGGLFDFSTGGEEISSATSSATSPYHWPWLSKLKSSSESSSGIPSNFAVEKLSETSKWTPKDSVVMEAESSTKESTSNEERQSEDNYDEDEDDEDEEDDNKPVSSCTIPNSSPNTPPLKDDESLSFGGASSHLYPPPPQASNPLLSHSVIYMSQYMNPYLQARGVTTFGLDHEKRKRNRTFIDPVSEVPRLEEWFLHNTHPSHSMIARYTEELNRLPYRQKFPHLEQKNIQFWFKNRRAKCKRMNSCI